MPRAPILALVVCSLAPFLCLAGCESEPERPLPDVDRKLVVASDLDHPPFLDRDATGKPIGRDVEMMERIGLSLGLPIEWEPVPFLEVLSLVEAGAVDVGCATLGISPEREGRVAFTRPYFRTTIAMVVRSGAGEPQSFSELSGKRVGCAQGTTAESAVRRLLRDAFCAASSADDATLRTELLEGELDALALDAPDADRLVKESQGRLARLRRDLDTERYALALPLNRTQLRDRIDRVLESLENSGELARLDERYGLR